MKYTGDSVAVAQFAADIVMHSELDCQSIMITLPAKSEDCSVRIVTDTLSEDTVEKLAQIYSLQRIDT